MTVSGDWVIFPNACMIGGSINGIITIRRRHIYTVLSRCGSTIVKTIDGFAYDVGSIDPAEVVGAL